MQHLQQAWQYTLQAPTAEEAQRAAARRAEYAAVPLTGNFNLRRAVMEMTDINAAVQLP